MAASNPAPTLSAPLLDQFMAATRQQESGGNYGSAGGGGYQIGQSQWAQWAPAAGYAGWADASPDQAPPGIQDAVARWAMLGYYYGPARRSWHNVAAAWNGGPGAIGHPIPNPALGRGATTETYADQVMAKMAALPGGGAQSRSGAADLGSTAAAANATGANPTGGKTVDCYVRTPSIPTPGPLPAIPGFCIDGVLWTTMVLVGTVGLMLGAALIVVSLKPSALAAGGPAGMIVKTAMKKKPTKKAPVKKQAPDDEGDTDGVT